MRCFPIVLGAALLLAGAASAQPKLETAVFAGGCFWTMEHGLEVIPGVVRAVSGYAGGRQPNPPYEEVSTSRPAIWNRCKSPTTRRRSPTPTLWTATGA